MRTLRFTLFLAITSALLATLAACVAVPEPATRSLPPPPQIGERGLQNPPGSLLGPIAVSGAFTVTGPIVSTSSITTTGPVSVAGFINTLGPLTVTRAISSAGGLYASGGITLRTPISIQAPATIGDLSADYTAFEADGTVALYGSATGWEDLRFDGLSTRSGTVAPKDTTGFRGNAAFQTRNLINTQADEVQFSVQMPHAWKSGSSIYPHVHISPISAAATPVTVSLVFDCYDATIGGTFPAASTLYTVTTSWSGAAWQHLLAGNTTAYTMTGMGLSAVQKCRMFRDNTVTDNYADEIALLYIDWHYEVDTPAGSRQPLAK